MSRLIKLKTANVPIHKKIIRPLDKIVTSILECNIKCYAHEFQFELENLLYYDIMVPVRLETEKIIEPWR